MIAPASLPWFARHELTLAWRDGVAMMTAGKPRRLKILIAVAAVAALAFHLIAWTLTGGSTGSLAANKTALIVITGSTLLSAALMASQALESVTRAFYTRADLDLILSSPAPARSIFTLRIVAIAVGSAFMALFLAAPFINVMVVRDGAHWLAAYPFALSLGALSTALAVTITLALFRTIGPQRTRFIAQVIAALIGASFVIGIQIAAILSMGSISRLDLFRSRQIAELSPDPDSLFWLPARAVMGETGALTAMLALGILALAAVIHIGAARFADRAIAAAGIGTSQGPRRVRLRPFVLRRPFHSLRRKEWLLLLRDPWLMSQSLMQVFYLIPPALLLWRNFGSNGAEMAVIVPILVMASGQLAGGLAWLAVSGEDAPDLVASAPLPKGSILAAKIQSVMGAIAIVSTPLLLALAFASVQAALAAAAGILCAASSSTAIQLWFRTQAARGHFRRRQTSSRIATFAEAFSSISWAGAAALAALGMWAALPVAAFAGFIILGTWLISPRDIDG